MNMNFRRVATRSRSGRRLARAAGKSARVLTLALASLLLAAPCQAAALLVDDFEGRGDPQPWRAWATDGAGTAGAVSISAGQASAGALRLDYSFQCLVANSSCGQLAMAIRGFAESIGPQAALTFDTRSTTAARLDVRVIDGSGQTLQYAVRRPPQAYDPAVWFPVALDLAAPAAHWGGSNSGRIEGGVRSLRFVVTTRSGQAESGHVDIDSVQLLDAMPQALAPGFVGGELRVDDFEDRPVVEPWTVWHTGGSGTDASLASVAGAGSARGMALGYAFDCAVAGSSCGQYAMAVRGFETTLPGAAALRFATRSPNSAELQLRVIDGSGQTLQYASTRPPEGYDPTVWYDSVIDLAKPQSWWGGAASGRIEQGIGSLRLLASTRSGAATTGAVELDDLVLLEALPVPDGPAVVDGVLTIDDFEDRPVASPWTVWSSNGGGAVDVQAGFESSRAMHLDYAFDCTVAGSSCGQLAMAVLGQSSPLEPLPALAFMTRSPVAAMLSLRIVDGSGQTLQYPLARPPEGYDPAVWYRAVADLAQPRAFWGGAASGSIEQGIKSIRLLVETRSGRAEAGRVEVDDVVMLASVPQPEAPTAVDGRLLIDDFEDREVVVPWSLWVSGGTGTAADLVTAAGFESQRAMRFDYSFGCLQAAADCGEFASATLALPVALEPRAALGFMTRSPSYVRLRLRVVDDSGQTLQYRLQRPLAGYGDGVWYPAVADLASPEGYWGGSGSGRIEGTIRKLVVLASSLAGEAVSGSVDVDDVVLLDALPDDVIGLDGASLTVDGFDGRASTGPWQFFAGDALSHGQLRSVADGRGGEAMALDFDLACNGADCGSYVLAQLDLPQPVEAGQAMSFRVRSPGNVTLALRLVDATGETLQYPVTRSLEGADESRWYQALALLDAPDSAWGGDGDGVLDGPIEAIAVVARNAFDDAAGGEVLLDDFTLLAGRDTAYVLDPGAATIEPDAADAVLGRRFGAVHHPGVSEAPLDVAQAAGLGAMRVDLYWSRVEHDGVLDFSEFDAIVGAIRARGLDLLLILDYGHADHDVRSAEGIAAFARYAAAAAARYASEHVAFEIWNEPNHPLYWGGAPDAGQYAALAGAALDAIRSAAPDAVVGTGGLSYFDFPYLKAMLEAGAADLADAVGLHAYEKPEGLAEKWVMAERLIRDKTDLPLPIWLTEWGYSIGTMDLGGDAADPAFLARQAVLTSRSLLTHWALGAEVSMVYKLKRQGTEADSMEDNFALFERDLAEKPSATALRIFNQLAADKINLGLLADVPPGLHVMVLAGEQERVYAAWQSGEGRSSSLSLPVAGLLGVMDHLGNAWMPAASTFDAGRVSLQLDEQGGPLFIRYAP